MGRNRIVSKRMSRLSVHTMHIGAIMLTFFAMVVLNLMASSSCSQLSKSIADKENLLKQKRVELSRKRVEWNATKSSSNLEKALVKRGMAMYYPKPSQIIRMDENGKLFASQASVAALRRRMQEHVTASFEQPASRTTRRRVVR
ncbi:MAG: hypothetical protein IKZ36_01315 [Kiritimatiellae bacterium]|nr:hypothetical protein [Kiritimatiellia bacterium]